ncbi:RNase P subunit p30-domain-containing protein, partial [Chytriomyces sp. MP71]
MTADTLFFDLNLSGHQSDEELAASVSLLKRFGYMVAAVNQNVGGKNPLQQIREPPNPPVSSLAPEVSQATTPESQKQFRLLQRLTVALDDANLSVRLDASNAKLQKFDLLAARPLSERALHNAVTNADVDIISLDLGSSLGFHIKKGPVSTAIQRGMFFEVSYAPSIRDSTQRKNIIANIQSLLRVTNGKNIILTSDAMRALEIRSTHDVMNLAQMFGIPDRYAREGISNACRSVLYHA